VWSGREDKKKEKKIGRISDSEKTKEGSSDFAVRSQPFAIPRLLHRTPPQQKAVTP